MADKQASYPTTVPLPPLSRAAEVAELLVGAIDLHCHSGPAAMPRILDHHEELLDAAAAKFRAVLYKDHFYAHYTINERSDGLVAMTMDGKVRWKTDQQPPFVRGGTILAPSLIAWSTACGLIPPDALFSTMPENSFTLVSGNSFSSRIACGMPA